MTTNLPRFLRGCSALAAAAALSGVLAAQTDNALPTPTPTESNDNASTHTERVFIKKATEAGLREIAISQAVMAHLANPQFREFARQMITDHTNTNNQLIALAQQKGVEVPAKDETSLAEGWSEKSGDLDRKYINVMVSDHEEADKLFERAAQSSDEDVASFAKKALPVIEHHLQMAKELKASVQ
jgi:putative membrane protein